MKAMRTELHNLHGKGDRQHEVYDMTADPKDYWSAVSNVPCPVDGCEQIVVWYEAGYTPANRVCMGRAGGGLFDEQTTLHRFLARGNAAQPTLVRDDCCEENL